MAEQTSKPNVYDLRSALALLETLPNELVSTDVEVDPIAELSGVYRYVGAGGTTPRPTKTNGPAMVFNKVKGYPNIRVAIGLNGSRKRVGAFLGCPPERLGFLLKESVEHAIPPVTLNSDVKPACQEVVHLASDPDFDLRTLLPAPTNTIEDAGPYFTMGLCYASDPDTGESDITIHRLCVQSKDELSMWLTPGRHIDAFRQKAEAAGKPLPISISIGVDPAIEVAACFEPPTTPLGYDELAIAGGLRAKAVEMSKCITINERAIAHAEVVIEGELLPDVRVREDQNSNTGKAMPEFPGYTGDAKPALPIIKVKAVTTRHNPILRTTVGPGQEHVNMAGIPTEASILDMVERAMPGRLLNVFAHTSGGGKLLAVMQFKKSAAVDEGRQRQAGLLAFSAFPELKHVIVVDEDVDIFDTDDVLWAMQTRYQGDIDTITISGVRCHPLDPSQSPDYSYKLFQAGTSCKTIFDCTVPFHLKNHFQRCKFKEVDVKRFLPDFES
ncbi:UbiD family decarboxylase [Lonepinella koalarum]|uniref:UbiD family decarboxylase n=1 Tax=Lonepinella koalarum TaxID=53417 RepID=UPI003F6DC9B4